MFQIPRPQLQLNIIQKNLKKIKNKDFITKREKLLISVFDFELQKAMETSKMILIT